MNLLCPILLLITTIVLNILHGLHPKVSFVQEYLAVMCTILAMILFEIATFNNDRRENTRQTHRDNKTDNSKTHG